MIKTRNRSVNETCWDGATASWVLPVLLGRKCALLKDTTRFRSSKYRDVELNALITSAWLSLERSFMKSLA